MSAEVFGIAIYMCVFALITFMLILLIVSGDLKQRVFYFFFLTILSFWGEIICGLIVGLLFGQVGSNMDVLIRFFGALGFGLIGVQVIVFTHYLYEYLSM